MPTPITSASPALSYWVTQHGASSVYVQKIISVVNASPFLNQLFNEFESRTLPGGSKPLIANREIGEIGGNWGQTPISLKVLRRHLRQRWVTGTRLVEEILAACRHFRVRI